MTLFTRARLRAGISPGIAYTHTPAHDGTPRYAFDRFNAVLTAAGLEAAAPEPCLPVTAEADQVVNDWLMQCRLQQKQLVLMHAGSSRQWLSKRWPEADFLSLAQMFEQRGLTVVWVGGEDDRDVNRRLAKLVGVDATAAFSYSELAGLGRHAVFAVTNDSGPMHVLAASRLPVYAFFGPTDWRASHALGQQQNVLSNPVPCSPCHLPVCPPEHQHVCLQDITPGQVLARLQKDGLL
jgi:ADP-heptose:LPS heptosyltransferase